MSALNPCSRVTLRGLLAVTGREYRRRFRQGERRRRNTGSTCRAILSDLSDAWGRYLEAPTPSVEPPQGPQDPTVEKLDEMDLLREEREQDTADVLLF